RAMARQAEDPKARINPVLLLIEFHIEIRPNRGGHRGSHFKNLDSCARGARKTHPTQARVGGQTDRHVSCVSDVLAGGAGRRAEYWNLLRCRRSEEIGLGGPWDGAAWVTRCGGACQAGEPRALAAASRRAAQPQASAAGHADAIATLMRRTLTRTRAPILSSLRRMVPQVALANGVCCNPMRRKAQMS